MWKNSVTGVKTNNLKHTDTNMIIKITHETMEIRVWLGVNLGKAGKSNKKSHWVGSGSVQCISIVERVGVSESINVDHWIDQSMSWGEAFLTAYNNII